MNLNGFAEIVRDEIVENSQSVTSLSEMECEIRDGLKELGAVWLGEWLSLLSRHYTASNGVCPKCEGYAQYERQREASVQTMLGSVCYKRAVYGQVILFDLVCE